MKLVFIILSVINGGYMLTDGIYVMLNGKYIGPEKPGPWAGIFYSFKVDVFKLGPLFIIYGLLWLAFAYSLYSSQQWAYVFGIIVSIITLWYLPLGTLISIATLVALLVARSKLI
jgi:hypothetical protein